MNSLWEEQLSDLYSFLTLSRVDSLIQRANFRFGSLRFEVFGIGFHSFRDDFGQKKSDGTGGFYSSFFVHYFI